MKNLLRALTAFILGNSVWSVAAQADNLHLIEQSVNGFAIYRSGEPNIEDMREFCRLGIQEMMVLSGDAESYEFKHKAACPTLKVIPTPKQNSGRPLTKSFLKEFDTWVQAAKDQGKKIAFRCSCGCHRTGRLAAYYQMKYQNMALPDALAIMNERGKRMWRHPDLRPQVQSLQEFIAGRTCTAKTQYCVKDE